MKPQTVFVTGGYGCIGAETVKWLIDNSDSSIVVCSRSVSKARTERVFSNSDTKRMTIVQADVTDLGQLQKLLAEHEVTQIVHLAALQTPECNAHRDLGLQINLGGTQNLIEAVKASHCRIERFVYASSIAVYGPRTSYPEGRVPMLAEPNPVNVYGAWKLAGEHLCRYFHEETGIPTVSLRPGVLYGPGRDAGLTAAPTTAMKHLALARPYEIPFCSRQDYLYAPDVGAAFGNAALSPFDGYGAFTLPSLTLTTREMVDAMKRAASTLDLEKQLQITVGQNEVPFICDLEYEPFLVTFPQTPQTQLDDAVRESIETFLDHAQRGWLSV